MHLVRLGPEPAEVGADIRAAISAWGAGDSVLGGVTVLGCRPPGAPRSLDAVIVLPRGVIVVLGVDLPEPALKLEAPLGTPWTVDGWPLLRAEGKVNPAQEALESAAALARGLQSRGLEPLPVAAIVAVGPYVGQVTQPTTDLHRGARVVAPNTTSILSAARELATYESPCGSVAALAMLRVLGAEVSGEVLVAEGFPASPDVDLAVVDTRLIPKYTDGRKRFTRGRIAAGAVLIALLCAVLGVVLLTGAPDAPTQRVDGIEFTRHAVAHDTDCAGRAFGDVRGRLERTGCRGLRRAVFETRLNGSPIAVSVAIVELPDPASAAAVRELLDTPGAGGIGDLVSEGRRWPSAPRDFGDAAQSVQQSANRVQVTQAVRSQQPSTPEDLDLRAMAERALRLGL